MFRDSVEVKKIENGYIVEYTNFVYQLERKFFANLDGVAEFLKEYFK